MTTKTRETSQRHKSRAIEQDGAEFSVLYSSPRSCVDTITYEDGPLWAGDHRNWKKCRHETSGRLSLGTFTGSWAQYYDGSPRHRTNVLRTLPPYFSDMSVPQRDDMAINEVYELAMDQFDLNTKESVMIYSGILQAVPLVGGCFKFVSIMNKLAKRLSRDMRKRPFTTVLKSAISADFIDRFVVSPTIDDARRFLDSHNYVVRTMQTMYERNSATAGTAVQSQTDWKQSGGKGSFSQTIIDGSVLKGTWEDSVSLSTKASILVDVSYETHAVSPIKLWAARCGITRPLDSAWDLVPFSFVIDYFTRAGDFISGLGDKMSGQDGLVGKVTNLRGLWTMQTRRSTCTCTATSITLPTWVNVDWWDHRPPKLDGVVGKGEDIVFERMPILNPYSRTSIWDKPFFRLDLSPTRLRTLAELVIQAKL